MSFPTRQQLLKNGRWPSVTVETECGPIRLASPSAAGAQRVQGLVQGDPEKARSMEVQAELMAHMLLESVVDAEGSPAFKAIEEARAGMESLTPRAVRTLVEQFWDLVNPKSIDKPKTATGHAAEAVADHAPAEGEPGGNSVASPSVA